MGGAVYPRALSRRDLRGRGVAQGRPTGKPTVEGSEITTWSGRPASLACSGDLQLIRWHGMRDHLLALLRPSRSLGLRRWAGRSMCDSLVRRARASSGPGRLGAARARRILHTHQAERAAEPVQSRRSACRASLLMRLSSDVRRCREELPEAARRRLPWLITAARRQAAHSPV